MKIAAMRLDIAVCWPRRECWIVYDFAVSPGSQRVWLRRECWVYMISQWVLGYTWALQRLCRWSKKKERKFLFLIFEHPDEALGWRIGEMLDQSQMKARDKAQMEARVRRLSQSSVESLVRSSVQCLIQCLMREEREEASFFWFVVLFICYSFSYSFLYTESCRKFKTYAKVNAEECRKPTRMLEIHENAKCLRRSWLAMGWQVGARLACKGGTPLLLYGASISPAP